MGILDDIFDGILGKINKNPLKWDEDAEHYVADIKLSKKEVDALVRNGEKFGDLLGNGFRGSTISSDSGKFYYEMDDEDDEDSEDD